MMENWILKNDNEIGQWQEAMACLPEKQFFNTMRLYLGEIKTPYNKQRLIEQLASFIHNQENTKSILTLMDSFDVEILTAISLIPQVTQESLIEFFSEAYTVTELYAEIISLTERLLIYKIQDDYSPKEFLYINPFLKEPLKAYLNPKALFPTQQVCTYSTDDVFILTPNILTAFISILKVRGIACKADGAIKKNDMNRLEEIFPGKSNFIQLLMNAFINLSLVKEGPKSFTIEKNRIENFAVLPETYQYALLCAAAVSRFSKEGLKKEAQLLIDCLSSIPETGYTRQTILRLTFLIGSRTEDGSALAKKSRFSRLLEAARAEDGIDAMQNVNLMDRMLDAAVEFGLLQKLGKNEKGEGIFTAGNISETSTENLKVLNIDSTSTVTLMPGLPLKTLLPLTSFMLIKKCGVVTEFEITRQSAAASFDQCWTPEKIFEEIEKYSYYEIPQNLKINISEWYNAYSSAMLYHGYILKVTESNIAFAENNPNIKKYIKEKLADGIYLLDLPVDANISKFIDDSGLDFLGNIKTSTSAQGFVSFPLLRAGYKLQILESPSGNDTEPLRTSVKDAATLINSLKSALDTRELDEHQRESLEHRISNRLILSETQLKTTAVRTEILEAEGMDFAGKVHLIEAAIKEEDLMELHLPSTENVREFFTIVGKPLGISKQPGEAIMRFQVEPTKDIENFLVSRITRLRRLRF